MQLRISTDREGNGRWIADVLDLPGVLTYGTTETAAITAVKSLALRTLADRLDAGELQADSLSRVQFAPATA